MARHLRNIQCPACAKIGRDRGKNNLGVYDDGSVYCYSCGYTKRGNFVGGGPWGVFVPESRPSVVLPSDCDVYIPAVARSWLANYDITEHEIIANKLLWSEYYQQLIFPYFDKYSNLVAWQGRSFLRSAPGIKEKPKWYSQGDLKSLFHIINQQDNSSLVLVEDVVSAIKVGRFYPTLTLFGNNISNRLVGLKHITNSLIIWLDPDMRVKTLKEAKHAESLGFNVKNVFSTKDPKEHTNEEIGEYLNV